MKIELKPRLERLAREKVDAGLYSDISDVVDEAFRLLEQRDAKLQTLRDALEKGRHDIGDGRGTTIESIEELEAFFEAL
jgi:putative addiction module CopG family antidote